MLRMGYCLRLFENWKILEVRVIGGKEQFNKDLTYWNKSCFMVILFFSFHGDNRHIV
jgi:hypothetical protein